MSGVQYTVATFSSREMCQRRRFRVVLLNGEVVRMAMPQVSFFIFPIDCSPGCGYQLDIAR